MKKTLHFPFIKNLFIISLAVISFVMTPFAFAADDPEASSDQPSISEDGRYVVFDSELTNLVAGDVNATYDIFLYDQFLDTTTLISKHTNGTQGDSVSYNPKISSDGTYVVYEAYATTLVTGDTNGTWDIFLYNVSTGATTRVSVDSNGTEANNYSRYPDISSDGSYVTYESTATNLVAGDTNGTSDIFLYNVSTGATTRVSVDSDETESTGSSRYPAISSDGSYVTYESTATNLVAGDTNGTSDIFLYNVSTGATTRVSVDSDETESTGSSRYPAISSDGSYVTYESTATNLVAGDTNGVRDIFLYNASTGATTRVSVDSDGAQGTGGQSRDVSISDDGNIIAFRSDKTNLGATSDTNGEWDVFIHNVSTGATTRMSVDSSGVEGDDWSGYPEISADGSTVVFASDATNFVAIDTNAYTDIFAHAISLDIPTVISASGTVRTTGLVSPTSITGTWDALGTDEIDVIFNGITYSIGDTELDTTTTYNSWTLDISGLSSEIDAGTYDVEVSTSNYFTTETDATTNEIEIIRIADKGSSPSAIRKSKGNVINPVTTESKTEEVTTNEDQPSPESCSGTWKKATEVQNDNAQTSCTPWEGWYKEGDRTGQLSQYVQSNGQKKVVGNELKHIQTWLHDKGWYTGAIDGIFGKLTKQGVRAFQTAYPVTIDAWRDTGASRYSGFTTPTGNFKNTSLSVSNYVRGCSTDTILDSTEQLFDPGDLYARGIQQDVTEQWVCVEN